MISWLYIIRSATRGGAISPKYNIQNNFGDRLEGIDATNFKNNSIYLALE